jgi:hypothetical protein
MITKERLQVRRAEHEARMHEIPKLIEGLRIELVQRTGSIIEVDALLKELADAAPDTGDAGNSV